MLKRFKKVLCMTAVVSCTFATCSLASTLTVDTKALNVRNEPQITGQKIGVVKQNEQFEILETKDSWLKIDFKGKEGWVSSDYVIVKEDVTQNEEEESNNVDIDESQIQKVIKEVTASSLSVRQGASTSAKRIAVIKKGVKVEVIETINGWDNIVYGDIQGWAYNEYLTNVDVPSTLDNEDAEQTEEEDQILKTAVINTSALNVRKESNTSSKKIGSLKKNAIVAIVGEENGWYKIRYNNQYGYISSEYTINKDITISRGSYDRGQRPTTVAQTATTLALQYVGCKYVWGGTSPNGFDCSGLVYYVYKDYVPNLGRSARPQATTGTTIEKENLVMGDLVFFGEDGGKTVTHVGIYVGDGIFVHAANSKRGVVTDTLLSGYYEKNFLHAKRIA